MASTTVRGAPPLSPVPTVPEFEAAGLPFAHRWVVPVVGVRGTNDICGFLGTASLIGGDLFLTARHVLDGRQSLEDDTRMCLAILDTSGEGEPRFALRAVSSYEVHSEGADLAVGRVRKWNAEPPFRALAFAGGLTDVFCLGYPEEYMLTSSVGAQPELGRMRFLKGYVMGHLQPNDAPAITAHSLELSFAINSGMSGSPVFAEVPGQGKFLTGIATHTADSRVVAYESVTQETEAGILREATARITEIGIAVSLWSVHDWRPELLGGIDLRTVVGNGRRAS
jgi:hypothetical protein